MCAFVSLWAGSLGAAANPIISDCWISHHFMSSNSKSHSVVQMVTTREIMETVSSLAHSSSHGVAPVRLTLQALRGLPQSSVPLCPVSQVKGLLDPASGVGSPCVRQGEGGQELLSGLHVSGNEEKEGTLFPPIETKGRNRTKFREHLCVPDTAGNFCSHCL